MKYLYVKENPLGWYWVSDSYGFLIGPIAIEQVASFINEYNPKEFETQSFYKKPDLR